MVAVIMQMINMTTNGGKELNPPNWSTSHLDSPEILDASDKAKPPPLNTNSIIEKRRKKEIFHLKGEQFPKVDCPVHISILKEQDLVYGPHSLERQIQIELY
jgi:hypothetical protein